MIFPTIYKKGDEICIGEVSTSEDEKFYSEAVIPEFSVCSLEIPNEVQIQKRNYMRHELRFMLIPLKDAYRYLTKTRMVCVSIFVDVSFYHHDYDNRQYIIESYVKKHAPWIFSYGVRRINEYLA
jgi:hypothetical protein